MVALLRNVEAVPVPAGGSTTLTAETQVYVVQELGGDFTVRTAMGEMFRISGIDADALGRTPVRLPSQMRSADEPLEEGIIWEQLKTCFDPEIPVNIVELGLVYECKLQPPEGDDSAAAQEGKHDVLIRMTLTAPGCGMGQVLADDVKRKVDMIPGVARTHVELTFDPPWNPTMMSDAARLETGFF